MNGDYLSYYPQFESNQVLTSTHLNELRRYLDEQIRITRAQLNGVGIACGLTFEVATDQTAVRVYEGFGISSEGYLICLKGELPAEIPANASPGGYSDYIKCRVYTDPSADLYWSTGTEAAPVQLSILELLTKVDAEQLVLDGTDSADIHDIEPSHFVNKVLVLYLEQNDIALKTCAGKDCDNKGSKRYLTPRLLLLDREAKASIDKQNPAEIVMTGLDGMLIRQPYPRPFRVPRLIKGLTSLLTPLQSITTYTEIADGYAASILEIQEILGEAIAAAYGTFGPFLGLTDREITRIDELKAFSFPPSHVQYGHDLLKDIARSLNEFVLLAYALKRDCCNDTYNFPRHLMLGTAVRDTTTNDYYHDKYRNYFVNFPMTWDQDRRFRKAQMLFQRILIEIKAFLHTPPNNLASDQSARLVPSKEDLYEVGKGSIPDYYRAAQINDLSYVWDPERTLDGLNDEVLSFNLAPLTAKEFVQAPFNYDIDDFPFFRIQNMLGLNVKLAEAALRKTMTKHNLAFEVVSVMLGDKADKDSISALIQQDCCFAALDVQYQALRVHIHAMVARVQALTRKLPFDDLEKGIAMAVELRKRFIDQTPVAGNVLEALRAPNLFAFIQEDGLPNLIKGIVPPEANDSPAGLFAYMYRECRTLGLYLDILLKYWLGKKKRNQKNPCDKTAEQEEMERIEEYLRDIEAFLTDNSWAVLTELVQQAKQYLILLSQDSPKLFHNFAKAHPGIEHLGGTYKGGTYVLVYERKVLSKGPGKIGIGEIENALEEPSVVDGDGGTVVSGGNGGAGGGTILEGNGKDLVEEGKVFFKANFDLNAIFEDVEGDEFWLDAAFEKSLERPEIKTFLTTILAGLGATPFSKAEEKTIANATVETIFADYLGIIAARTGRLVKAQTDSIQENYIHAIQSEEATAASMDISRGDLDNYISYIQTPAFVEAKLPSAAEAAALTDLLVEILAKNDKYLPAGQIETLLGLTPNDVWPQYLVLVGNSLGVRLNLAAINELTSDYLLVLEGIDAGTLLLRNIRSVTMEAYIDSIKNGTVFEVEDGTEVLDPLLAFLIDQVRHFGRILLSKDDLQLLSESTVPTFWTTFLEIFAKAVGERNLDADIQRNLTSGFAAQLSKVDPVVLSKANVDATLPTYIETLESYVNRLAAEAFPDQEDISVLINFLVDKLKSLVDLGLLENPLSIDYDAFRPLEPEALWPSFVNAIKAQTDIYSDADLANFRGEYANYLLDFLKGGGIFDRAFIAQLERYILYVGAAGPNDNPFMRAAIVEVLTNLGLGVLSPRTLAALENQSVSVIWPQFVRSYLRLQGNSYEASEIETLQKTFIDKLKEYDAKILAENGITDLWESYIESLSNAQPPVEDLGGMLVGFIVSVLKNLGKDGLAAEAYDALRLLSPAEVLPTWIEQLLLEGIIEEKDQEATLTYAVQELVDASVPRFAPAEFLSVWEAYLAMITGKVPTTRFTEIVVADFSLPYRIASLSGLPKNVAMPAALPPILAGGDTAYVQPGAAVDIRILENDDQASGGFAEDRRDLDVEILHVIQPPGGLGGVAHLISDPNATLLDAPKNILRYEANWGEPITDAEIVEIVYSITDRNTNTRATGTVLVFVSYALGVISDPCCCCKDYSYVVKRGEKLTIRDVFKDFEDQGSIVLTLIGDNGNLYSNYNSDSFLGVVLRSSIEFTSKGDFEGTVSFGYNVSYAKGLASCQGRITVHVVCPCLELPCEVTVNLQPGETLTVANILTPEQIASGMKLRLNDKGADVFTISNPDPLIKSATVIAGTDISKVYTTIEVVANGTAGSVSIPFFKGVMVGSAFDIQGDCTLKINLVNTACISEANVVAGEGIFVTSALTGAEISAGMVLRFSQRGTPSSTLSPTPFGLDNLSLTRNGQGFNVLANVASAGDLEFEYFKGQIVAGEFVPSVQCTMTLHIESAIACVEEYTLLENQTLIIDDLLGGLSSESTEYLQFDVANAPSGTLTTLPAGAASLKLIADPASGVANSAFILQPDYGFFGTLEWPYFRVDGSAASPKVVHACTIRVTVIDQADCVKNLSLASGVETVLSETLMKGEEVRFYNGGGRFGLTNMMLIPGAEILELNYAGGLFPLGVKFKSAVGFAGNISFKTAVGRVVDGIFRASRICTVNITVTGAAPTFVENVTAEIGRATIFENLISSTDIGAGIDTLRFMDGLGNASETPPSSFTSGELILATGSLLGTANSAIGFTPKTLALGVVTVQIAKGKMSGVSFVKISEGDLNIDIVPNEDCAHNYTNVSGGESVLTDLLSPLERSLGLTEIRFFENGAFETSLSTLPKGLVRIELTDDGDGKLKNVKLASQTTYEGQVSFEIAVAKLGKNPELLRICTVIIDVSKGGLGSGFEVVRTAPDKGLVTFNDLLTEADKGLGMTDLRFDDGKGNPTTLSPELFGVALLELISFGTGLDAINFEADGSISGPVPVVLYKGKMNKAVFEIQDQGTLTIDILPSGEGGGTTSYTYDRSFEKSTFYNAEVEPQTEAIFVLNTAEGIINTPAKLNDVSNGAAVNDLQMLYVPMIENLKNAVMTEPEFNRRAYYLRLFALELQVALEMATRIGDIKEGSGLDDIFRAFEDAMFLFLENGYFDQTKSTDRITIVLTNQVVPPGASNMNAFIMKMLVSK